MSRRNHTTQGFTVLELLLAVSILGVLLSTTTLAWREAKIRAYDASAQVCARDMITAEAAHYADFQLYGPWPAINDPLHSCIEVYSTAPSVDGAATQPIDDTPNDGRSYRFTVKHPLGRKSFLITEGSLRPVGGTGQTYTTTLVPTGLTSCAGNGGQSASGRTITLACTGDTMTIMPPSTTEPVHVAITAVADYWTGCPNVCPDPESGWPVMQVMQGTQVLGERTITDENAYRVYDFGFMQLDPSVPLKIRLKNDRCCYVDASGYNWDRNLYFRMPLAFDW